ncbi:hypothetical protein MXB_745 [Myxobolus squamalis]|nr:hypothetical protein MXB_745 [Myxobolus squamalis]
MSITFGEPKKAGNFFKKPVENGQAVVRVVPRPKSINEITSQAEVVLFFTKVLETNDLPNMLFYGPPGTGKTSSILALARDLLFLGKSQILCTTLCRPNKSQVNPYIDSRLTKSILPPYKLIVLDEADNMTSSAQNLEFLVNYSDGDLRKAIMRMQSCRYYINTINKQDLVEICGGKFSSESSKDFYYEGYSLSKFLVQDVDKMLSDGADEFLQLMSILSHIVKVTKDSNQ